MFFDILCNLNQKGVVYVKVREVIADLKEHGFKEVKGGKGSHRKFRNKEGYVTIVSGKLSDEMPQGTVSAILRQSGIKK